jgi:hypothetical protein
MGRMKDHRENRSGIISRKKRGYGSWAPVVFTLFAEKAHGREGIKKNGHGPQIGPESA